jgi:hypothetical protein
MAMVVRSSWRRPGTQPASKIIHDVFYLPPRDSAAPALSRSQSTRF